MAQFFAFFAHPGPLLGALLAALLDQALDLVEQGRLFRLELEIGADLGQTLVEPGLGTLGPALAPLVAALLPAFRPFLLLVSARGRNWLRLRQGEAAGEHRDRRCGDEGNGSHGRSPLNRSGLSVAQRVSKPIGDSATLILQA